MTMTLRLRRRDAAGTAPDDTAPDEGEATARAEPLVLCAEADAASTGAGLPVYIASDDELTDELRPDSKSRFRRRSSDLISTACW